MTKEQQKIVNIWVQASLMQPSKYWPFEKQSIKQLAKDKQAEHKKILSDAGEAFL